MVDLVYDSALIPLVALPPASSSDRSSFRFPFPESGGAWRFATQHSFSYQPTYEAVLAVPGIVQIFLFGEDWKLVRLLSPLGYSIAWRVTYINYVFDEELLDDACECQIDPTHGVAHFCDSQHYDTEHPEPWVEYNRANLKPRPNKVISPHNKYLAQVRDECHSSVTRFCELTRDSQQVYRDLMVMLEGRVQQSDGTYAVSYFVRNTVREFLVDVGIPSYQVSKLVDGDCIGAQDYLYT